MTKDPIKKIIKPFFWISNFWDMINEINNNIKKQKNAIAQYNKYIFGIHQYKKLKISGIRALLWKYIISRRSM